MICLKIGFFLNGIYCQNVWPGTDMQRGPEQASKSDMSLVKCLLGLLFT